MPNQSATPQPAGDKKQQWQQRYKKIYENVVQWCELIYENLTETDEALDYVQEVLQSFNTDFE